MFDRRIAFLILPVIAFSWAVADKTAAADEWKPIDPAELKMTSEPKAPGASAIYLYRQVDRDDQDYREFDYFRIKILSEEGRSQANVGIPFVKGMTQIKNIKARTIRPDGTIVDFAGTVFEKTIIKAKGVKYLAKFFTLPDVQVGSVIEYQFLSQRTDHVLYDSGWTVSAELFTKHAKFSLKENPYHTLRLIWQLPPGAPAPQSDKHYTRLELDDVPAFEEEPFMPPQAAVQLRVNFVYLTGKPEHDPEKFWKQIGNFESEGIQAYINKSKEMDRALAQIVSPTDAPEVKLRKVYARVQQLRNLTYERNKTEAEQKREKERVNESVEDVWKNQYGYSHQLNWLFLALVRAGGFEAYPVLASARDTYFFEPKLMNAAQLAHAVVLVRNQGEDLYCDPGTPFTPLGYLPWPESGVIGLRLANADGSTWITTRMPRSGDSFVSRSASFRVTEDGELQGSLKVTYSGLEALWRRLEERQEDQTEKSRFLEDQVKAWIPVTAEVKLANQPDWNSSDVNLVAEFDVKARDWTVPAGQRQLVPVGFFSAPEKHLFEHAIRRYPLYFDFPTETQDNVNLQFPSSWAVTSIPPAQNHDYQLIAYSLKVENQNGQEHITRLLRMDLVQLDQKYYDSLRKFFQQVRAGDQQQIMVQPGN